MKEFLNFMLPIWLFALIVGAAVALIERNHNDYETEKRISANLFKPHGGNLKIETLVYEINGSDTTTIKKTLLGVTFAQLKLYPTIGCTKPTLFYLSDNYSQIKQMVVDRAKIIE